MRWLRLVGSLKVKVFFAKEPYKRDDILQERPIILWSLLIVATPYAPVKLYSSKAGMGWLRLVGSFKVKVFFAKEPYERDNFL